MSIKITHDVTNQQEANDALLIIALFSDAGADIRAQLQSTIAQSPTAEAAPVAAQVIAPTPPAAAPEMKMLNGVEVDANGTPWIDGVHATTKSKNKDHTWRSKRGIDQADVETAEAEARLELNAETTVAATAPVMPPIVPVSADTVAPVDFAEYTAVVTQAFAEGVLDEASIYAIIAKHGFADPTQGAVAMQTNETARAGVTADVKKLLTPTVAPSVIPGA